MNSFIFDFANNDVFLNKDCERYIYLDAEQKLDLGVLKSVKVGFKATGAIWRSKYDMPPDDFAKEVDRLWEQLRPLYLSLHAYVPASRYTAARPPCARRRWRVCGSRQRPWAVPNA